MIRWSTLLCLLALGCEAKARPQGVPISAERRSAESETCGRTADCAEPMRCVDSRCTVASRSDVGDYHLVLGEALLGQSETDRAIVELRAAEAEYKRLGEIPADVNCALGAALAELRADPLIAEEAAAKLHRCVQGLVDGSAKRRAALRSLALLAEAGFDPSHLAGAEVADRYLTKAPEEPKLEDLTINASADRPNTRQTFVDWMAALRASEVRAAVVPCWKAYWEASKEEKLTVKLPYRYGFRLDPNDEAGDRGILKATNYAPPGEANLATATKCVEDKLAPIADKLARSGGEYSWSAKVTLVISP